jgi:hypothetical protein
MRMRPLRPVWARTRHCGRGMGGRRRWWAAHRDRGPALSSMAAREAPCWMDEVQDTLVYDGLRCFVNFDAEPRQDAGIAASADP